MKRTVAVLALLGLSLGSAVAAISDIPAERQVILKTGGNGVTWSPLPAQVKGALSRIQAYLDASIDERHVTAVFGIKGKERRQWIADQIQNIRANYRGYRVQFWGVSRVGKELIYCNFFPAAAEAGDAGDEFATWKQSEVSVDDGGYNFWNVLYDPATKTVVQFDCNGVAFNWPSKFDSMDTLIAISSL